jgi:hypothetical protein
VATSGTISTTVFNTRKVIDSAYRGCRLPAQSITGEMIETAKEQLFLMMSAWLNQGWPLWCQTKYILGFTEGLYSVVLPRGVIDVLDANIRDTNRLTEGNASATSGVAGNAFDDDFATTCDLVGLVDQSITLELNETAVVTTVGVLPATTGSLEYSFQYSEDGIVWTVAVTGVADVTNLQWLWFDAQGVPAVAFYRLEVGLDSLPFSVRELVFANRINEINLARLNRDDYFYLPDKNVRGRPVQYWLDRQRENCIMNIWPAPDNASRYRQLAFMGMRHIMDVGTLQQELEVPQRWYEATVWNLAKRLAIITPEVKPEMLAITAGEASSSLSLAWAEERDRSPINIVIDLSPYTR